MITIDISQWNSKEGKLLEIVSGIERIREIVSEIAGGIEDPGAEVEELFEDIDLHLVSIVDEVDTAIALMEKTENADDLIAEQSDENPDVVIA